MRSVEVPVDHKITEIQTISEAHTFWLRSFLDAPDLGDKPLKDKKLKMAILAKKRLPMSTSGVKLYKFS